MVALVVEAEAVVEAVPVAVDPAPVEDAVVVAAPAVGAVVLLQT